MHERVAILVIHGIGQQKPYESLDRFTRNLMDSLAAGGQQWAIKPRLDRASDPIRVNREGTRVSYLVTPPPGTSPPFASDPESSISEISLFEYYWAPFTQGKITYTGSLLFLIKAGLQPFLYLASNINALGRFAGARRTPIIILKELWRQSCLFVPLLALFFALLGWLKAGAFEGFAKFLPTRPSAIILLAILAIRCLYLYSSGRALLDSLKSRSGWQKSLLWRAALIVAILAHLFAWPWLLPPVLALSARVGSALSSSLPFLSSYLRHWATTVSWFAEQIRFHHSPSLGHDLASFVFLDPSLSKFSLQLLTLLLAIFVRFILVDYVGDIAVYVNTGQFSKNYAVRSQIINECTSALSAILLDTSNGPSGETVPRYDRVLIAAHSLGSVIAYDTMNNLLNVAHSSVPLRPGTLQPQHLVPLRGLATFGSPLNKIFYFFREQDDPELVLRRQTLDLLHGFRIRPNVVDVPTSPKFEPVSDPRWEVAEKALKTNFCWINAYSLKDPISGKIVFYDVDCQKLLKYPRAFVAHSWYWEDPLFYEFFRKNLL